MLPKRSFPRGKSRCISPTWSTVVIGSMNFMRSFKIHNFHWFSLIFIGFHQSWWHLDLGATEPSRNSKKMLKNVITFFETLPKRAFPRGKSRCTNLTWSTVLIGFMHFSKISKILKIHEISCFWHTFWSQAIKQLLYNDPILIPRSLRVQKRVFMTSRGLSWHMNSLWSTLVCRQSRGKMTFKLTKTLKIIKISDPMPKSGPCFPSCPIGRL